MKPFMVKPEWRGDRLYCGSILLGRVANLPIGTGSSWAAFVEAPFAVSFHPTEAAARAAVEAAVARELTGGG